jgi:hypothetical protein
MRDVFTGPPLLSPSFVDALRAFAPDLLEQADTAGHGGTMPQVPHGTTVAAVRYADGVVMGGDRRATEGLSISQRDIEKVFPADDFSAVAIAGAAGPAIEMVRLFQTELEHYEKVEGFGLSLEGKANRDGSSATTSPVAATRTATTTPTAPAAATRARPSRSATATGWTVTPRSPHSWRRCTTPPTRTPAPAVPT